MQANVSGSLSVRQGDNFVHLEGEDIRMLKKLLRRAESARSTLRALPVALVAVLLGAATLAAQQCPISAGTGRASAYFLTVGSDTLSYHANAMTAGRAAQDSALRRGEVVLIHALWRSDCGGVAPTPTPPPADTTTPTPPAPEGPTLVLAETFDVSNTARIGVRVTFDVPVQITTPRSDGGAPGGTDNGDGTWTYVWAQNKPPSEGCEYLADGTVHDWCVETGWNPPAPGVTVLPDSLHVLPNESEMPVGGGVQHYAAMYIPNDSRPYQCINGRWTEMILLASSAPDIQGLTPADSMAAGTYNTAKPDSAAVRPNGNLGGLCS